MLETYSVIGAVLTLAGAAYVYIFVKYILQNKANSEVVTAVSEALVTIAIGIFYIYSAVTISNVSNTELVNFTNTIGDILIRNDTFDLFFVTKKPDLTTSETIANHDYTQFNEEIEENIENYTIDLFAENMEEETPTTEHSTSTTMEHSTSTTTTQKPTQIPEINKTEQFVKNYQNFINEMIKHRRTNSSILNQTIANMKYGPPMIKTSRAIKLEPEENNCNYNFFIENALLLFSFVHCLITLIKNTIQCRECLRKDSKNETTSTSGSNSNSNSEVLNISGSEKNDMSAPVGPLFESGTSRSSQTGPNLKLFEARGTTPTRSNEVKKQINFYQNHRLIIQILLTWLLPILGVTILYFSSRTEHKYPNYEENILSRANFTIPPMDADAIPQAYSSANVSSEVDRVVNQIYNIVSEVQEKVDQKTTHFTPMMTDVIYFVSQKSRNVTDATNICSKPSVFLKVYYFLIFIVCYFIAIMYAKTTQTLAKETNFEKAQQQNICLLTFTVLWLPSILEIFYRMFVSYGDSTVISDIFMALGNSNRIQTMFTDHTLIKKIKPNFVNPV